MKPSSAITVLVAAIGAAKPVMLRGKPGVGKTKSVHLAAAIAGAKHVITSTPVTEDPTDPKGMPWVEAGCANFIPFGQLKRLLEATEKTVWFIDDFGQASEAVQASYMPWIRDRELGGMRLPDCVSIVAATNGREHKAGVKGMLAPLKGRFVTIIEFEASLPDWTQWAMSADIDVRIIAFLQQFPDFLVSDEPGVGLTKEHNPRAWEDASEVLSWALPTEIETECLIGALGQGAALELVRFMAMYAQMVGVDAVLASPDTAPIPTALSERYALMVALAYKATIHNFARVSVYLQRLAAAGMGEFAILCCKDCLRRTPTIEHTAEWLQLMLTPIGGLFRGEVLAA